jgi:hypothetical protein
MAELVVKIPCIIFHDSNGKIQGRYNLGDWHARKFCISGCVIESLELAAAYEEEKARRKEVSRKAVHCVQQECEVMSTAGLEPIEGRVEAIERK